MVFFLYVAHCFAQEKKHRKYFAFLSLYDTYLIRLFQLEMVDGILHGLKLSKEIFHKRFYGKSSYIINCVIFIRYIHHTSFNPTSKGIICYILAIISVILQVTFEGITGRSSKGDIAIDDFSLNLGPCPSSKHFPVIVWNILQKQRVFKNWSSRKGNAKHESCWSVVRNVNQTKTKLVLYYVFIVCNISS